MGYQIITPEKFVYYIVDERGEKQAQIIRKREWSGKVSFLLLEQGKLMNNEEYNTKKLALHAFIEIKSPSRDRKGHETSCL